MPRYALPLLCLTLFQGGCQLQVPLGADRGTYPALAGEGGSAPVLRPGETTREQVLARLGPPMFRWDDETVWEYVEYPLEGFYWFFPAVIGHGSPWGTKRGTHYLMLRFTGEGTLHEYEVLLHPDSGEHDSEFARFREASGATTGAATAPTLRYGQRLSYGPSPQTRASK